MLWNRSLIEDNSCGDSWTYGLAAGPRVEATMMEGGSLVVLNREVDNCEKEKGKKFI